MLKLNDVTLLSVSSVKIKETIKALKYSMRNIEYAEVLLLTHQIPKGFIKDAEGIFYKKTRYGKIRYVQIAQITDINTFNYFMVYELYKYIRTNFILQVHYDGFVVHPELWRDEFLKYDYIGSPWSKWECFRYKGMAGDEEGIARVGNSVGIRSLKLLTLPSKYNFDWCPDERGMYNEDTYICVRARHLFEKHGITYAPLDVAKYFGREMEIEENKSIQPFLFHKWDGKNVFYAGFGTKVVILIKRSLPEGVKLFIKNCVTFFRSCF